MSMLTTSLKRRIEALQNECDLLAQGMDNLSLQLQEAYHHLKDHEPAYVARQMGQPIPETPDDIGPELHPPEE
ncbi:hypothetical protein [Rhizobium sp. NFR12]|uniref:hypothetical protein n=1 Tax=Rhizobium sp. NFR12 TaxID=1566261 RepID=UPI0008A739D9|nr:hypothetical protein [Rhizobium sp. NFR12]SEH22518.1 hypothetical protein SAMN03159407_1162 [Rhizobium sp. NFR12]